MDHNSYPMKKLGYNTKDYKTMKPNSCSSNFRYCLLFTTIIQMLIILGLVLFMTYGNTYSSHQSHLETSQNQSVQLIGQIQNQKDLLESLKKNLTSCNYKNGNLTAKMKNMVTPMRRCILYKNCTDYFPFNAHFLECNHLKRNNTDFQMKLAKCMSDLQLTEMRQKLKEIELEDQIRKLYQQLRDFGGNCTSLNKDFRTTLTGLKASYDSFFTTLTSGKVIPRWELKDSLNQLKTNCSLLSLSFETEIQQRLSRIEIEIETAQWTNVDQQKTINNLKMANEECKKDAAIKLEDSTKELQKFVQYNKKCIEDTIKIIKEKDNLAHHLNFLRNRHQLYHYPFNGGATPSFDSSCQVNVKLLQKNVELLNFQLTAMQQKETFMDLKLKEQEAKCRNCRMPEYTG